MKVAVIALMMFLCACSNEQEFLEKSTHSYPRIIDSLGLQHLYDETKWNFYCLYGQDTFSGQSEKQVANSDLKYEGYIINNDTVALLFLFDHFGKKSQEKGSNENSSQNYYGIIYKKPSDTIIGYVGYSFNGNQWLKGYDSTFKYCKPLQPEVVTFIKENKDKIHPWFRKEAEKRGVITE